MNLDSLVAIIHAIRDIEPTRRIILFGSSSLLASFPNDSPTSLGVEITIDADVFLDPDDEDVRKSLHRLMGQGRQYHQVNGFYCDFIDARADGWFPRGWKQRLITLEGLHNVFAMRANDVAATKLAATAHSRVDVRMARRMHDRGMKDIETVVALLRAGHLTELEITESIRCIDMAPAYISELAVIFEDVQRLVREPQAGTDPTQGS